MKTDGSSVADRLQNLKLRIDAACRASGREPQTVRLLAVSKLHPFSLIQAAFDAGQTDFGENYVQEALEKLGQVGAPPPRWHFIGRIQSNKAKLLGGGRFAAIHSVDRQSIAEALNTVSSALRQDIFLQYNVARESSKGGVNDASALALLADFVVGHCPNLRLRGLMVMPPQDEPPRPYFAQARGQLERLRANFGDGTHALDQLSMGTSGDFADAIAEGATWIRIGTEIFGPREEKT